MMLSPRGETSFLRLRKVFLAGRWLPFLGWHQIAVAAHEIIFLADSDIGRSLQAGLPAPVRILLVAMPVGLVDGPGPRQRVIEHRDHVMENVLVVLINEDFLLEDRLIVEGERNPGRVIDARSLERAAGFDLEHVIDAVAAFIEPSPERKALIGWLQIGRPGASIGENPPDIG